MQLTHVRILVDDIELCKTFYADQLGLGAPAVAVPGVYYEFAAGAARLGLYARALMHSVAGVVLSGADGARRADQAVLTFAVEDVDAACAALQVRGIALVTEPQDQAAWVLRVAHLRDPEGHLIELNAPLRG